MRKQNAEFITAFTSEANKDIKNTDFFGFVELDQFACYVIADGIDDKAEAIGAKLAVDAVVSKFMESPSMSKRKIAACLKAANHALLHAKSKMKLKVSITMVVTDYVKLRYGQAGNTRFRLYRNGFLKEKSRDQSLSTDYVKAHRIEANQLEKHEERNNLYSYLGQKDSFHPYVSKKIKLLNSDAVSLYTRGLWEEVDEGELSDAFADATDEPQATIDMIEELLLSKQSPNLEKYTLAVIFINKIYIDPNRKRKIKRFLMVLIPILTAAAVLGIVFWMQYSRKMKNIELMNQSFTNTVEYIQVNNYLRAKEEADKAQKLAETLKDKKMQTEIDNHRKLIESVIAGDEKLDAKQYADAQNLYQKASNRARYADNLALSYISERLKLTADYMSVYDLISLGDTLALNLQYDKAEEKYLQAKALAGKIYFDEGRTSAIDALEKLYEDQKKKLEEKDKELQEEIAEYAIGANSITEGDAAFAQGDYGSAKVFYSTALQKYENLGAEEEKAAVEQKIQMTDEKIEEKTKREKEAEDYLKQAESSRQIFDIVMAKKYYLMAKDIYASLKNEDKVGEVSRKIELMELGQPVTPSE